MRWSKRDCARTHKHQHKHTHAHTLTQFQFTQIDWAMSQCMCVGLVWWCGLGNANIKTEILFLNASLIAMYNEYQHRYCVQKSRKPKISKEHGKQMNKMERGQRYGVICLHYGVNWVFVFSLLVERLLVRRCNSQWSVVNGWVWVWMCVCAHAYQYTHTKF